MQNIQQNSRVQVRLGDQERQANARVLDEAVDREAWQLAQELGRQKYDWGDGLPVEITPDQPF